MAAERPFGKVQQEISDALVKTTRTVSHIASEDVGFIRASDPSLIPLIDGQRDRFLALAQGLVQAASKGTDLVAPRLRDVESVDNHWRELVDVFDNLLEKADASLDESTGLIKRLAPSQDDSNLPLKRVYRSQIVPKPQLSFDTPPDNLSTVPFKPLLTDKPHALVPLAASLVLEDGATQYRHPYAAEIAQARPSSRLLEPTEPIRPLPFDSTTATFVDTLEAVYEMLVELEQTTDIAVDLEHHDNHSYVGLVSLMQISTRDKDWVIDTLRPWRRKLQVLNRVFANPDIVKVFHGSYMDMIWLQRDLGLYVVGLFDTFHASKTLGYARFNLAFLLKKFVNFDAEKQYQLADWRIRPLPTEMFNYARSDTHFLLYIFDMMRNELLATSEKHNLVEAVWNRSKEECSQRYEKPVYDEINGSGANGWFNALYRTPTLYDREQFAVFRALHKWRDRTARATDESLQVVMSKRTLFALARQMPLNMSTMLELARPYSQHLHTQREEVLDLIRNARAAGDSGPDMRKFFNQTRTRPQHNFDPGLGATVAALRASQVSETTALSSFWGPVSVVPSEKPANLDQGLLESTCLYLPMPEAVDVGKASDPPKVDINPIKRKEPEREEPQTLRHKNEQAKRARSDHGQETLAKAEKSRAREQRKAETTRRQDEAAQAAEQAMLQPFDYTSAPSILNDPNTGAASRTSSKGINPYAKSLDAPKGLPRTQRESAGRSFTFK